MFKLILFSMLDSERMGLRVMESYLLSAEFKQFLQIDSFTSKYDSMRDHIGTINSAYFERLQQEILEVM